MLCIGSNGDIVMLLLMTTAIRWQLKVILIYLIVCFAVESLVLVAVLVVVKLVEVGWWWL